MTMLGAAFAAEWLKIRKSKMIWMTLLGFTVATLMCAFLMFILLDPQFAHRHGLLSAKAQLQGSADWPAYFGMLAQVVAIGGIVLFGFVASWVFGREFSDRTAKDLLALPVSRTTIVLAKFIAILLWCAILSALVVALGLLAGWLIGLPGWAAGHAADGIYRVLQAALLTSLLSTPVALAASWGRGYLPPMGIVVLVIFASQIISIIGYGAYFPWSVPAIVSGAAGPEHADVGVVSYVLVATASLIGFIGTIGWWRYADHG